MLLTTDYRKSGNNVQVTLRDKTITPSPGVVVYCHGHGGDAWGSSVPVTAPGQYKNIKALTDVGYLVIATDTGLPSKASWGNDSCHASIDAAIATAQGTFGGRSGKVIVMGTSMGGQGSLSFAARYPAKVAACIAIEPMVDLNASKVLFSDVQSAYNGGYTDAAYGADHNPRYQAGLSLFANMPVRVWYGDSDTTATPADVLGFVNAVKAKPSPNITVSALVGGHSEDTTQKIVASDLTSFAAQYLSPR